MMKVSLITLLAREWDLTDIFRRIANQTLPVHEWIFVDYCPERHQQIQEFGNKLGISTIVLSPFADPDGIKYIRDIGRNRNLALTRVSGDAVIFLDDYVVVNSNFIYEHAQLIERGIISCGMMYYTKRPVTDLAACPTIAHVLKYCQDIEVDHRYKYLGSPSSAMPVMGPEWTYTGNLGVPVAVVLRLNGFDPRLSPRGEDNDFGVRASMLHIPIWFNPKAASVNFNTNTIPYAFDTPTHAHTKYEVDYLNDNPTTTHNKDLIVKEIDGEKYAVCSVCGAREMVHPGQFILAKRGRNESEVPRYLFNLKRLVNGSI